MDAITLSMDDSNMTLLSNSFIDFYMKDANDAQIKLYLYLLRSVSHKRTTDLSQLADVLNYSEKDILRALKYWERKGVLTLRYDRGRKAAGDEYYTESLLGIRLEHLNDRRRKSTVRSISLEEALPAFDAETADDRDSTDQVPQAESPEKGKAPLPDADAAKQGFSLDDLRSFKNSPDTAWILTVAQQYLGKPLSPSQIRSLLYFYRSLSMSGELIDYLLQYCVEKNQTDFRYIEATAAGWAELGITTVEQARHQNGIPDKEVRHIMDLLGRSGSPAPQEKRFINRWLSTYAFPMEIIEEACGRAVLAVEANRFPYVETILKQWHDRGVHTMEDVRSADEAFRSGREQSRARSAEPAKTKQSASAGNSSTFCNFQQQDYDFRELESKLVDNF
ncbi:MAG: DnaD domain protein [Lachnospiraceae bacterium]|nr:DnaD domain protein [Lachnospiraceae bacterium]